MFRPLGVTLPAILSLALVIVTAIGSTSFLQMAMEKFNNNVVVPTYYVTFTLASVCAGAVMVKLLCGCHSYMCLNV